MRKKLECLRNPEVKIRSEWDGHFDVVDSVLELFERARQHIDGFALSGNEGDNYRVVLLASGVKVLNALLSTAHLCSRTLTEDARTIVRKMLEQMINLLYVNLRTDTRDEKATQILMHGKLRNKQDADIIRKSPQFFSVDICNWFDEHSVEIEDEYERSKAVFPTKKGRVCREYVENWSGKPLRQLMIDVGLHSELISYELFCGSTHFGSTDVVTYMDLTPLRVRDGRESGEVPILLLKASKITGQVLQLLDMEFGCGIQDDLDAIQEQIAKLEEALIQATGQVPPDSMFDEAQVARVSEFLQQHMQVNSIDIMVPDECAELLARHGILPNDIGPKPGFNFRQMLRDGRDGLIPLVKGARQAEPHKRWYIDRVED